MTSGDAGFSYAATDQRVDPALVYDEDHPVLVNSHYFFWEFDQVLGTRRRPVVVDAYGSMVSTGKALYTYDPYGVADTLPECLGFCGKLAIRDAQLYDFGLRFYDPALGRFVQPDPLGAIDTPNCFWYARNNPLVFSDPIGLLATPRSQGSVSSVLDRTPPSLLHGARETSVYLGLREGVPKYVGQTRQPLWRRESQHGFRFDLLFGMAVNLTPRQGRAIEQAILDIARERGLMPDIQGERGPAAPAFQNIRNSISPQRVYYAEAVAWGRDYLRTTELDTFIAANPLYVTPL